MKSRPAASRSSWWERAALAVFAVVLWWIVYWNVTPGYGPGSGVIAATCLSWAYVLVSYYVTYVLNARSAGADDPRSSSGRWPGARP